ncbi:MAG: class I SAM-dependent methyltransferase [Myxococcaceae bacterium]
MPAFHSTSFAVSRFIPPHRQARRVLEVGCGSGGLAQRLIADGMPLVAIDPSEKAIARARKRGVPAEQVDFLTFRGGPFDALLFTRSLHHISPLPDAVAHAHALLAPGGVLVCDEFAVDAIDPATAAWFYDLQAVLEAAGSLEPDQHELKHGANQLGANQLGANQLGEHRLGANQLGANQLGEHKLGAPQPDPVERWRLRHAHHDEPLHSAGAMLDALSKRFSISRVERLPYLHRYLSDRLPGDERGAGLFRVLREQERLRVEQKILAPIGLRIIATRS